MVERQSITLRTLSSSIYRRNEMDDFGSEYGGMRPLNNVGGVQVVRHGDDNDLPVQFYKKAKKNKHRSEKEGRPVFENKDYIRIFFVGSRDYLDRRATEEDKVRFARQWKAYQDKEKTDWEGTPLEEWSALDEATRATLKYYHVYTVEQLVSASDATLEQIGMGSRDLQKKARIWLDRALADADATRIANEKAALEAKFEALQKQNEDLLSRLSGVEASVKTQPKRRGRPPKKKKTEEESILEELNESLNNVDEGSG
jgi:hypothetical protein